MKKRKLGRQGLEVSALGLGCMGMSFAYGEPPPEADSLRLLDRALELGINFWDTAEIYGPFHNEILLGKSLNGRRDKVTVATKFAWRFNEKNERTVLDSSPVNIRRAVEGSLKRLGTDYIDLLYQHRVDPKTPIEETMGACAELVKEGKVRFIGLSEAGPKTIRRAHAVHPVSALQSEYSIWETGIQEKIIPVLHELGIGLVPYSPVGRGFLTGQIQTFEDLPKDDFRRSVPRFQGENFQTNLKLVEDVKRIAAEKNVTPSQVALAWLLSRSPDFVPIPGTTRVKHLEENAKSVDLNFSKEDWKEIDAALAKFETVGNRYPDAAMGMVTSE